ncbi:xanthine dehydrogenase family protein subunit M [Aliishimia ponticola]|uniref:Xanthine dehydrogenase family protein subunit M n=2 Tax=Aliishimia ponticola TaxID=2499833 RepID=A0A4S4NHJ2_9RHOB|nr:FAD binding domain-containing protein [Aliishimia ponticola]THH39166.1 xanthine dehydrogenase family protein subunit M [Aliishimia ponticola]
MPTRLDEALGVLADRPASILAGGTDYYPARGRQPEPRDLLDISRVEGLRGIRALPDGNGWHIGAATTWSDIAAADLPSAFAGLQSAAREVGSRQIQNTGTVAGNLCNASPAADGVPPLLTLDAQVEIGRAGGTRRLALGEFITGVRQTALAPDEMVIALHIPSPADRAASAFHKLGARKYLVISITMTAALVSLDANGRIAAARVAVGACSPVAQRLHALEADVIGKRGDEITVTPDHLSCLSPITDMRADSAYRADVVAEQAKRVLQQAVAAHG